MQQFAQLLRGQLRSYDVAARWGGEEFLVVLTEVPNDQAWAVAERLREAMANRRFERGVSLTISVGVANLRPADSFDALLQRADDLLLQAKREGRNRTLW